MNKMLENIRIVLVETSHSGNIGSAARAMKTMGLTELYLVSPKQAIDEQSLALAAGAENVVKQAKIVPHFDDAIADCTLVIGTSARLRHLQNSLIEPRECGEKVFSASQHQEKIAIVFGRERVGLTNDELQKCRYHLTIPANPDYSSLNLAMAVQLVCYEIRMAFLSNKLPVSVIDNFNNMSENKATSQELTYFFEHTERLYQSLGFIQNQGVMQKLKRLYQRADVEKNELNILRGMLTAVEKRLFSSHFDKS